VTNVQSVPWTVGLYFSWLGRFEHGGYPTCSERNRRELRVTS
jgi:hypothetical protein